MTIFFDLDGTLIDTSLRHYTVYSEVVCTLGGNPLSKTEYWGLKKQKQSWLHILPKSNVDISREYEFLQQFITKIESTEYLNLDTLIIGAPKILEACSTVHDSYLVSLRRNHSQLLAQLQRLGIEHYFTDILSGHSETDGFDKKVELIRPRLSTTSSNLIIGDTEADIITGQTLGLTTVAVLTGIRTKEYLERLNPDYIITSVQQLPIVLDASFKD